jgi:hypothetical protein
MVMMTSRRLRLALFATAALGSGCATSSHVVTGATRPPISPEEVRVYTQPPAHFEEIAALEASSRGGFRFTDQGKMDKVIERLKVEAAKLGANGVLLQSTQNQVSGSLGTGGGSTSYGGRSAVGVGGGLDIAIVTKEAHATAIYIPNP